MALRVHDFSGTNPNSIATYDASEPTGDDEGAPPMMPSGARVTKIGDDGEITAESSTPQSEAEMAIEKAKAAAKLAAGRKPRAAKVPRPGEASPALDIGDARALRARCLEIAARGNEDSAEDVIAAARALLAFVENG